MSYVLRSLHRIVTVNWRGYLGLHRAALGAGYLTYI